MSITKPKNQDTNINILPDSIHNMQKNQTEICFVCGKTGENWGEWCFTKDDIIDRKRKKYCGVPQ